jgi:hypothetical protein
MEGILAYRRQMHPVVGKRGTHDITTIRIVRFREPALPFEFDDSTRYPAD